MDGKSPKATETDQTHLSAVQWLRVWLRQEGGNEKIPRVLDLLAEKAELALARGLEPPAQDVETLAELYFLEHGGELGHSTAGRWLRGPDVRKWWDARHERMAQAAVRGGLTLLPALECRTSTGRGNSTEYCLRFDEALLASLDGMPPLPETGEPLAVSQEGGLIYTTEPAKAAWWLGWLSSAPRFPMRSWRGYTLAAYLIVSGAVVIGIWALGFLVLIKPHQINSVDLAYFLVAVSATWLDWQLLKPIVRLPWQRVTVLSDALLRFDQMHGQFHLVRDARTKAAGGWFSVVRYWGTCPVCSGEVDLREGRRDFPGRLVGRCSNAPSEHVFSFDPVRLTGRDLHTTRL